MTAVVEIEDLTVRFGSTVAVAGLTLSAQAGAVTAIVGANGAGKTTTVETCEGLRYPTSGEVRVLGLDPKRDARSLHTRVGVMLQEGGVASGARPREALRHMARLYQNPLSADALLERLGLAKVRSTYRRMSGGEQQRLKFALAIVGRPELVFLDEPTAGLDAHAKRDVWTIIEELRANGVAIILTTHLMDDVERLADHIHVVKAGKVLTSGTSADLVAKTESSVEFTTASPIDVASLQAALPDAAKVTPASDRKFQIVGGTNNGVIAALSQWSDAQGVHLESLQAGRRFEDVFVDLTADDGSAAAS